MPALRIGRPGRQALVHADVVEAGLRALEPLVHLLDQLERRVGDLLVVVPPLPHEADRIVVHLRGVRDVVALPRVGLVLRRSARWMYVEIALADVEQAVSQHARRAGDLVDEVARGGRLRGRQDLAVERFRARCAAAAARTVRRLSTDRRRDVAQQADGHLAVEIDVLDELHELNVGGRRSAGRRARDSKRPRSRRARRAGPRGLIGFACTPAPRRPLGERAQRAARAAGAAADHMQLIVEDEQIARRAACAYAAGSNISIGSTSKKRPNTSFIARSAAAMPPVPARKLRRSMPSFLLAARRAP